MQQSSTLIGLLLAATAATTAPVLAQAESADREPPLYEQATYKQEVVAERGVVASNHPLASAAGQAILARGGNAVDALVATLFALSVVEPSMVSPFGSGFANLYTADGRAVTLDNYTVAPGAATPDMYRLIHADDEQAQAEAGHRTVNDENTTGFKAIGVPGGMKAWLWLLHEHGSPRIRLPQVLGPALDYAENGFVASPVYVGLIRASLERHRQFPGWVEEFLPSGVPPVGGQWVTRPGYAVTLRALAEAAKPTATRAEQLEAAGRRFYLGDIGRNIVRYLRENGGLLTMDDMQWYWGDGLGDVSPRQGLRLREPLRGTYRGYEVIAMPPTSSGGTHILEILNILEGWDLGELGFGSAATLHLMSEAMKIAWADRDAWMGDPDYAGRDPSFAYETPPVDRIIDKAYAAGRRDEIDEQRAGTYPPGRFSDTQQVTGGGLGPGNESSETTHATAIDSDGNVIAATQTVNRIFGSGVVLPGRVPGSGLVLNDTMDLFDPDPRPGYERANAVAARKRQLSSMSPTIVLRDGEPWFALGTPGGTRIYATVLQGIVNVIDHGMSIQQAVEAPRIWTMMYGDLEVEHGIADAVAGQLRDRGHAIKRVRTVAGGMNGVLRDPDTGLLHGGACWRRDGSVAGWSGGDALPANAPYPAVWTPSAADEPPG
jgi:gamma-glutamyltranspeptidase/glutathione hydrolase